jgi:hypothetical protein
MSDFRELVQKIHDSQPQAVLAVAGAGSEAVAWLLGVAGASRTLIEVVVPYGSLSMIDFIGHEPSQYVSVETATDMARAAYNRALLLRDKPIPVLGLGCTATIATDRPKRGEHRCCIATWTETGAATYSLRFDKGRRDRAGEEQMVSWLLLQALSTASGLEEDVALGLVAQDELVTSETEHGDPLARLLSGEVKSVLVETDGVMSVDATFEGALLPGSFSPFHEGHRELARTAGDMLRTEVCFEISVVNVDKPPLAKEEVERRLGQFLGEARVVLTRAETFRKKSDLFPGATFVIGWDTAVRLVAPRYYGGETPAMLTALAEMWASGARFLVAGREDKGAFYTLDNVEIPEGFRPLFQEIPESRFRKDISSTALRGES